ncbi:molybdopterin converting factor subunit 1 [Fervidibacillus albus]|uniref:Molybdopterin synthase sulfur carrier subunit n=1 Tax=Fervidibacillus albus TaxID=2980026 RepID=A0A9E8LTP3_9BACI|nr:molybdopterin converting factor subunit 1 [Fervidibacillus albus]WAA09337.1 molybdopterin converting factor subunit 1 [Fervidibacillus albus]
MIKIYLFAQLQEDIGQKELQVEFSNGTIKELKQFLKNAYPQSSFDGIMVAINEEYAFDTDIVRAGDTIAFIPPVSGG